LDPAPLTAVLDPSEATTGRGLEGSLLLQRPGQKKAGPAEV